MEHGEVMLCKSRSPNMGIKWVRTSNTGPLLIKVHWELMRPGWKLTSIN